MYTGAHIVFIIAHDCFQETFESSRTVLTLCIESHETPQHQLTLSMEKIRPSEYPLRKNSDGDFLWLITLYSTAIQSFDVFFIVILNKLFNKKSSCLGSEPPRLSCNVTVCTELQMTSPWRDWRCSWSSADRRCSSYIWVINNFIAH